MKLPTYHESFAPQISDHEGQALGMKATIAALLSYLITVVPIFILIAEKENRFARFHALQALLSHILFAVFVVIVFLLLFILGFVFTATGAFFGGAGAIVGFFLWAILIVLWVLFLFLSPVIFIGGTIYSALQAANGKWFKYPIVGNLAAKLLGIRF